VERQYVGIDLHRRRSVIVRRTPAGETLETVRITNDPVALALELAKAGPDPEVVLEATYGWYWASDVLQANGANVHLAHPLGNNWGHRRVKNDERDATDLVDLLRLGRLAEAWIAPPALRELRELVRYRAKLVALRSGLKAQVHAVLAKEGVAVPMSDLFGVAGRACSTPAPWGGPTPPGGVAAGPDRAVRPRGGDARRPREPPADRPPRLPGRAGHRRGGAGARGHLRGRDRRRRSLPGRSPAVLVGRADADPSRVRHHRASGPHHQQGSRLVRWAAVEAVQRQRDGTFLQAHHHRVAERRGRGIGKVAAARKLLTLVYYGLRDGEIRCLAKAG